MPKPKRIYIVDDHPLIRHGLFHAVTGGEGLCVCGMAATVAEAADAVSFAVEDVGASLCFLPGCQ